MNNEINYVDLTTQQDFNVSHLRDKRLLVLPSQGESGTKILNGIEGEMLYEHRQEGQAMGNYTGIFVSRTPLPIAEENYRKMVFGGQKPKWYVPSCWKAGVPLDQIVLADEGFLDKLAENMSASGGVEKSVLYGFNETKQMEEIADKLGIKYYGNSDFANWAGVKVGLQEFASECGVPTPMTFCVAKVNDILDCARILNMSGYQKMVIKVNHSTGGMGHKVSDISQVLDIGKDGDLGVVFPEEFMEEEGAVAQGWIPEAISASLATFVDFDGKYYFEGAQAHVIEKGETAFGAIGAMPISREFLNPMLEIGKKIAAGYVRHKAWGSHTMGMLIVPPEVSTKLGLPPGTPLCNDENTRPGATTISKAWIMAVREGKYGIGWIVSKIAVPKGMKIAQAIEALDENKLLIKKANPNASGIFVFNGSVLDSGYEGKFYAVAISGKDDPDEAKAIMAKAVTIFS